MTCSLRHATKTGVTPIRIEVYHRRGPRTHLAFTVGVLRHYEDRAGQVHHQAREGDQIGRHPKRQFLYELPPYRLQVLLYDRNSLARILVLFKVPKLRLCQHGFHGWGPKRFTIMPG